MTRSFHIPAIVAVAAAAVFLASSCGSDSPIRPGRDAIATIRVGDETFRVLLTTEEQVSAAASSVPWGAQVVAVQ